MKLGRLVLRKIVEKLRAVLALQPLPLPYWPRVGTFIFLSTFGTIINIFFLLFLDSVQLTHLAFDVYMLESEDGMKAIGSLCPHLESMYVNGLGHFEQADESKIVSPDKLDLILKDWPKVIIFKLNLFPKRIH